MVVHAPAVSRFPNLFARERTFGGDRYFDYQRAVAERCVLPWLRPHVRVDGAAVCDLGCHHGGMLDAFRAAGAASGLGVEPNEALVRESPFHADERFRLEVSDAQSARGRFYLVVLHDVLEHVGDVDGVLRAARGLLAERGRLFVSFPPYGSPFGGHQFYAAGSARAVPYLHLLPGPLFFRLARPADTPYMRSADALEDMRSVRRTRLTLARAEAAFAAAGMAEVARELFLVRPEHTVRYGLRTRAAGALGRVRGLRELAVSGAYYLLAGM